MKFLIIGGAGFIGFHLTKQLLQNGYEVDLIDQVCINKLDRELVGLIESKKIAYFRTSLENMDDTFLLKKDYSHVIHLAAMLGVQNVINNAFDVLCANVNMTIKAIKIAQQQTKLIKFVFASTSEVYAGTQFAEKLSFPTPEHSEIILPDLAAPRSSYMLSKIYGESLCKHSGLPYVIVRPHNIYGPRMGMKHVIPQLLQKSVNSTNGVLEVQSCDHRRTFCFISDAVDMISFVATSEDVNETTINIGNEAPEISILELAKIINKVVGKKLEIKKMPATAGSPSRRVPDMSFLRTTMNYQPKVPIIAGVTETFEWYKKNERWKV